MNKIELAKEIAERMSLPVTVSLKFIDTMCDILGETIGRNDSVLLQNFGHFQPWQQNERSGRNPRTGVTCPIRKRLSVKFKPGKGLLENLNDNEKRVGI